MIGPKRFFLGGIALFALTSVAAAADMPIRGPVYTKAPAAFSWEGQYIGVHGGYAWSNNDITITAATAEISPSGGIGGLQIGYNHQISRNWILGYEIDVSFGDLNSTTLVGANITTLNFDAFGTARARVGYVQGPWMLYATGGVAWAAASLDNVAVTSNFERPHAGYALGAGVEYAFAPNWSAKLEYIFADLGRTNTVIGGNIVNTDLTLSSVRLGLNYRFANWRAPVAGAFPVKAPVMASSWTGSYIGAHGGYAWGSFDTVAVGVPDSLDPKGGFGGIQSGYNWQLSRNWVIGVEGDSSWGSISQTAGGINVDVDAMGTVRARLGYAMNNVLFYGTGGLAWAHADSNTANAVRDQFYLGWAAGAGIEYAFAPRWSAKLEYIYADYGTINDSIAGNAINAKMDVSTVKLGINYRASLFGLLFDR